MVVIIQNDPEVPAGTYGVFLKQKNVEHCLLRAYEGEKLPPWRECTATIVLGGSMGVNDEEKFPFLLSLKGWVREAVANSVPFLGICLGGQLLSEVLGGQVLSPSPHGERGFLPVHLTSEGESDPLFDGLPPEFVTFQWHDDSFSLPPKAVSLASSRRCPCQAFRIGQAAYGIQFHPEIDKKIVSSWVAADTGPEETKLVLAPFEHQNPAYCTVSIRILANFLRICGMIPSSHRFS